jgi:hypothetical protein
MQNSHTVYVTIGRNIGETPMPDMAWKNFRSATSTVVRGYSKVISGIMSDPVEFRSDASHYNGEAEESSIFVMFNSVAGAQLRERLTELASVFGQDSIALVDGGLTEFISAE